MGYGKPARLKKPKHDGLQRENDHERVSKQSGDCDRWDLWNRPSSRRRLCEGRSHVVVAGRRAAEGEDTVRLLRAQGGEGFFVTTDVSKAAQVEELVERTMQKFGRLDFAFNNAGIEQEPTPFLEQDEETYDRVMDINVKGVWLSMKYEIPAMLKTGGGTIVNTSSSLGVVAMPGIEIYAASKHAVIGLTKSAAVEFGKQGIRINAVLPAAIETDMLQRFVGDNAETRAYMAAKHPIGRIG